MTAKRTLSYMLSLEVEIDGTPDGDDEMLGGVAADIQLAIPGVLCDLGHFVVLVNSTEIKPVEPTGGEGIVGHIQCAASCGTLVPVKAKDEGEDHLCGKCLPDSDSKAENETAPGCRVDFNHKTAADLASGRPVSAEDAKQFALSARWAHEDRDSLSQVIVNLRRDLAAREAEIAMLKASLMEQEADSLEQARLLGMGGEREATLLGRLEELGRKQRGR